MLSVSSSCAGARMRGIYPMLVTSGDISLSVWLKLVHHSLNSSPFLRLMKKAMSCAAAFVASPVSYDVLNQSFLVASVGVGFALPSTTSARTFFLSCLELQGFAEAVLVIMGNVFWFQSVSKIH